MRILTLVLIVLAGGRDDFKEASAKLAKALAERDHNAIVEALKALPPEDPRSAKLLLDHLKQPDWWLKGRIVGTLEKPGYLKALLEEMEQGKRKDVREACAWALGQHDGDVSVAALTKSLADPDWRVRRAAALALGNKYSKERVDALIARLPEEKDTGVQHLIAGRLALRTRQSFGVNAEAWASWWKANRDGEGTDEEGASGQTEFKDFKLSHDTVAAPDSKLGILILPDFPAKPAYFRPHLDFLAAFGNLHYLRLPDPRTLATERSASGNPIYPVENLVGALEKLRFDFKEEKFIIIGHGATVWLAMAYARNYPESVAGLIFFGAYVDDDSFVSAARRALSEALQKKDPWLEGAANYRLSKKIVWKMGHTLATFSQFAADPGELALARVHVTYWEDYSGTVTVPDVRASFAQPLPTPALFLYGRHDAFSGLPEYRRATKYLSAAQAVAFDNSGALPFLSESDKFTKTLLEFVGRVTKKK
jgi:pimeloyl-ACP methyl ester carboxylesterase